MKFLVDRCAGATLARWLRDKGHDVQEARERGPDPGDEALFERLLAAHQKELAEGAVLTVRGDRVRISR
jgi:predicted nuclease of predicted toxin-antitoxin system